MKIVVEEEQERIDKYLQTKTEYTRNKIQDLIKNNKVLVNSNIIKASYKVNKNDIITIDETKQEITDIVAQNIKLDIYYEDDDVLAVNKESGMVVHPASGRYKDTLVNALMYHCNNLSTINGNIRPGIVHRIDADTSGLLLVAKNDFSHASLAKQISKKEVLRKYIALVEGVITENSATIDAPIGRDINNRKKMCITATNSKNAITHIKVLERYKDSTLIECSLETGRTHQIRVHMKYINHPIVNDPVYNNKKPINKSFGQMLHAKTIGFIHPRTNKYMEFNAPAPAEFNRILKIYQEK